MTSSQGPQPMTINKNHVFQDSGHLWLFWCRFFLGGEHARALLEQTAEIRAKLVKNLALKFSGFFRVFSVNVPPQKKFWQGAASCYTKRKSRRAKMTEQIAFEGLFSSRGNF